MKTPTLAAAALCASLFLPGLALAQPEGAPIKEAVEKALDKPEAPGMDIGKDRPQMPEGKDFRPEGRKDFKPNHDGKPDFKHEGKDFNHEGKDFRREGKKDFKREGKDFKHEGKKDFKHEGKKDFRREGKDFRHEGKKDFKREGKDFRHEGKKGFRPHKD